MDSTVCLTAFSTAESCKEIFHSFYPRLCLFANKYLDDFNQSEDIVQSVFLQIISKSVVINSADAVKSYLYSSVSNACLNHIKRQSYIEDKMQHYEQPNCDNNNYVINRIESEVMEDIFKTIEQLPPECRKVFKMSYIDDMDVATVAQMLNISENTVKTQRLRARKFLKENLKDLFPLALLFMTNIK